jgi:hypothetical protein
MPTLRSKGSHAKPDAFFECENSFFWTSSAVWIVLVAGEDRRKVYVNII